MRLFCHVCGKVQAFTATSSNSIACEKCNHQQPVKSMPRKAKSGSLTGSEKFVKSRSLGEIAAGAISGAARSTIETGNQAARVATNAANSLSNATQSISNSANSAKAAITGISNASSYLSPDSVAHGVPIAKFDLGSAMGSDLFSSESSIKEMGIVEATQHRSKIARQSNALDVGIAKTQRDRKAVKLANELRLLQGDAIDYHTTGINNSTKVVRNQIADRDYQIEYSKLEEKDELLTQQQIKTRGTQALTPLIAEHWQLKIKQQESANQSLVVDIEKGIADIDTKRIELEARLIEASTL